MICNFQYQSKLTNKKIGWLIFFCLFSSSIFAASNKQCGINVFNLACTLRPIVSIGGGAAISSDIGKSKTFPIINSLTDEFYVYSAKRPTKAVGVFDSFVGAEWAFHPEWSLQVGMGYNQAWNFDAKGVFLQGADAQSADQYSYHYTIFTRQLLAEVKLLHRLRERYLPYILLGLGASFNDAFDYETNVPPFLTFTRQYKNHTQSSFSYAVGVGIDVDVFDHLRFGVGYRFVDFGQVKLGAARIDTTNVSGTISQMHLYANEILAQITLVI